MKRSYVTTLVLLAVFAMVTALPALAGSTDFGAKGAAGKTSLSLEQMLNYAVQDEYLARAEYELIMDEYGRMRPFSNIAAAEEQHITWLAELYGAYGFTLPVDTAKEQVVLPPDLEAAFQTGVQAEIDNIAMYQDFLKRDLPADVREVFERLMRASENHLRAFRNNLNRYN